MKIPTRIFGNVSVFTLTILTLASCEGLPIDCMTQNLHVHRLTENQPIEDTECQQIKLTERLFKQTFGLLPPIYQVYQRAEPWQVGEEFVAGRTTYHLGAMEISIRDGWCQSSLAHEMLHALIGYDDNHKDWEEKGYYKQIEMIKANCLRGY